jgi:hypothetical protein
MALGSAAQHTISKTTKKKRAERDADFMGNS